MFPLLFSDILSVDGNDFSQRIPSEVGLLEGLSFLIMANNTFTGYVPSQLGLLSNLKVLELHEKNLSGTIPSELGQIEFLGKFETKVPDGSVATRS